MASPFGRSAAAREPFLVGFATTSSAAALPHTLENLQRFGVPRRIQGVVAPWARVPHLASHLLGRIARRLARDWHRRALLETFCETARFRATCRAANWIHLGRT